MTTTTHGRAAARLAGACLLLLAMLVSLVGPATPARALSANPEVVISQIFGGGGNSSAPLRNDYVELFNRSSSTVSLNGWSIQYASATGTGNFGSNQIVVLSGSLAPGQYYLVQLGSGGTNGSLLPTADATGTIAAAAGAGKFALINSTTGLACNGGSTPCTPDQIAQIVDLVGYGNANFFEGAGAAPTLSATTAALRAGNGCTDTNNNSADFSAGSPAPRNTASPLSPCGPVEQPIVVTAAPASISTIVGTAASSALSATDADSVVNGASITGGAVSGISLDGFTAAAGEGGTATATLNIAATVPVGNYSVIVAFTNDEGQSASLTVPVVVNTATPMITRIHEIQGSGPNVTGSGPFTVEAVVVGAYQAQGSGQLRGFFLQEEDADVDADPATSEGIFVFCSSCPVSVSVGDVVQANGAASDFFGMSQISATAAASVTLVSQNNLLPTPATPTLPVPGVPAGDLNAARAAINAYFEQFEGMLVRFDTQLKVAEYFELARYGQVVLAAGERPRQFTDVALPSVGGFTDHQIDFAARTIILDDDNNGQNDAITGGDTPYYHPVPGLSIGNRFRGGDTITGLTGVLHWSFAGQSGTDAWRIRPVVDEFSYAFTSANTRPAAPALAGNLRVAAYNVLNYFLTVDTTSSNSVGICGPTQSVDCRGADSVAELVRQREKLTQALLGLDADIIGLIEMENTPGVNPTQAMVDDLNAIVGAGTYSYVATGVVGTDAIRVGMLYRPAAVSLVGNFAVLDSNVDPEFDSSRSRPALAQTFRENASGAVFTVVVNHFKSKGDSGLGGSSGICTTQGPGADVNCDKGDGQGFWNDSRTRAAQALARWLATDPTDSGDPDIMIVGDLNAYRNEDPVRALETAGYVDLIDSYLGGDAYSYLFSGQLGYLDHALANPSLAAQVVDVDEWHINADEVPLFDYNDDILDPGEASFERESSSLPLYEANAFRTSDHDPVLVGLNLTPLYRAVQGVGSQTQRVGIERHVGEAELLFGYNDFDKDGDGWALVGRTNGAGDNGDLRGLFVEGGVPYAVVFNYSRNKGNRCILVTPRSLDEVRKGQTRVMQTEQDPYLNPALGCVAP